MKNILLLLLTITILSANDNFGAFLEDLNEVSTKNKKNIDYMPSTVSILNSNDLALLGATKVHEALSFVPGIEVSMIQIGWKRLITRGMHNPDSYIFDKMKLFIDGNSVNSRLFGTIYYYMNFPLDLVDRIEVLRGASSALYGDGAYNGAINIITKRADKNELHFGYGSNDYKSANAIIGFSVKDFHGKVDAYVQNQNLHLDVSNDFVYIPNKFNRDVTTNEDYTLGGFGLSLENDTFKFLARYNDYKSGNYFGFSEFLDPTLDDKSLQNKTFSSKLLHNRQITDDISLQSSVSFQHQDFYWNVIGLQDELLDFRLGSHHKDESFEYNTQLIINSFKDHSFLAGIDLDTTRVTGNQYWTNLDYVSGNIAPVNNGDIAYFDNGNGFLDADVKRKHFGFYIQDIYNFNEKLAFSFNARYDDFKNFDSDFNFRVGSVYELNEEIVIKTQYAESFRVPSFIEAFQARHFALREGNELLDNEKQNSFELSLVYIPSSSQLIRLNTYYAKYHKTIDINDNEECGGEENSNCSYFEYSNQPDRNSKGIELEYKYEMGNSNKFSLIYSYTSSTYNTPDVLQIKMDTPSIANHIAKAYYLYNVNEKWSINTTVSYTGVRGDQDGSLKVALAKDNTNNSVNDIDDYIITNISSTYKIKDDIDIRFTVNDIFNEQEIFPSYRSTHKYLPRDGRSFLVSINYIF